MCAGVLGFVHALRCRPSQLSKLHQEQSLQGVRQTSLSFLGDQWTCFWNPICKDFAKSCKVKNSMKWRSNIGDCTLLMPVNHILEY